MDLVFEELDYQITPLGTISLRRRTEPRLAGVMVYEVKLDDEFLMSSLFTDSEEQLAHIALDTLKQAGFSEGLDIVVGGLGLGYTALAALKDPAVRSLRVVEVMQAVIDWHRRGLVPIGKEVSDDPRCILVQDDFFALARADTGFNRESPEEPVHAVLLDIDHSPCHWLDPGNSAFYTAIGLRGLKAKLHPGGVFALWSNDPEDDDFTGLLASVFESASSHRVSFANPYTGDTSSCTVYLAQKCA